MDGFQGAPQYGLQYVIYSYFHLTSLTLTPVGLRCLSSLFYAGEFKRMQSSLPVVGYPTRKHVPPSQRTLLETKNVL